MVRNLLERPEPTMIGTGTIICSSNNNRIQITATMTFPNSNYNVPGSTTLFLRRIGNYVLSNINCSQSIMSDFLSKLRKSKRLHAVYGLASV